jgi:hypothetical protein
MFSISAAILTDKAVTTNKMYRDSMKLQSFIHKSEKKQVRAPRMDLVSVSEKAANKRFDTMLRQRKLKSTKNKSKIQKQIQKQNVVVATQQNTTSAKPMDGEQDHTGSVGNV